MSRWAKLCFFLTAAFYLVALSVSVLLPLMVSIPIFRETAKIVGPLFFYIQLFAFISPTIFWNLAFVVIAADVLTGRSAKRFIVLPLLWFGGYATAALISDWQAHRFTLALTAQNESHRIAFSPETQDILIEPNESERRRGALGPISAYTMVETLGLKTAYELTEKNPEKIKKAELQFAKCSIASSRPPVDLSRQRGGRIAQNMCVAETQARPEKPIVRVQVGEIKVSHGLLTVVTRDLKVIPSNSDENVQTFQTGSPNPLPWLPLIMFNCRFGALDCSVDFFRRTKLETMNPNNIKNVVSQALGLKLLAFRDRYPQTQWQ